MEQFCEKAPIGHFAQKALSFEYFGDFPMGSGFTSACQTQFGKDCALSPGFIVSSDQKSLQAGTLEIVGSIITLDILMDIEDDAQLKLVKFKLITESFESTNGMPAKVTIWIGGKLRQTITSDVEKVLDFNLEPGMSSLIVKF